MKIPHFHPWNVSPEEAKKIQEKLKPSVLWEDSLTLQEINLIAGIDNCYWQNYSTDIAVATVVVFSYPDLVLQESQYAELEVYFPYIPSLLAFREAAPILSALEKITLEPDLLMFDAHGAAHPDRMGLATHLGVLLDKPAIGCAKKRLTGLYTLPDQAFSDSTPLVDDQTGDIIGAVVRTRPPYKPLFISPGHKISLSTAVEIALNCTTKKSRIPEPIRRSAYTLCKIYVEKKAKE